MKILTYQNGDGGQRLGALAPDSEHVIDLTAVAPDAVTLREGGVRAIDAARHHVAYAELEAWRALDEVTLCAPVPRPSSIRETMTFEAHIINAIRVRLGPLAAVDERVARIVGTRRSIAGLLNRLLPCGRLLQPGDAQAEPSEADVTSRTTASIGDRTTGLRGKGSRAVRARHDRIRVLDPAKLASARARSRSRRTRLPS
jgi:hypothetical protein